jgi:hypothetical protein
MGPGSSSGKDDMHDAPVRGADPATRDRACRTGGVMGRRKSRHRSAAWPGGGGGAIQQAMPERRGAAPVRAIRGRAGWRRRRRRRHWRPWRSHLWWSQGWRRRCRRAPIRRRHRRTTGRRPPRAAPPSGCERGAGWGASRQSGPARLAGWLRGRVNHRPLTTDRRRDVLPSHQ